MSHRIGLGTAVVYGLAMLAGAGAAWAAEIKGAAILEHACGKTSMQHMGLVHAGKMAEAVKLGTPSMQQAWNAMPKDDREMMAGMMKEMSSSADVYAADIKAHGLLVVDGKSARLTITKEEQGANGSSKSVTTQNFLIDAKGCWISE